MEHTKHIIRAVLLLAAAAVLFVVGRHFAIPATFGEHGHYRFASVAEHAAIPPIHGAPDACDECHEEQAEIRLEGKHSKVSCEVCHGPLAKHIQADEKVADMPIYRTYELCARCHQYLIARPKSFPQVVLVDHVIEKGGEMTDSICLECHDAHNPSESAE